MRHFKDPRVDNRLWHGFRTVISDVGANLGIIITTSKYQAGAFDATSFTNIKLLTWEEFQEEFEEQWIRVFFYPTITKRLDPLFTYTEPILPAWFGSLQVSDKELYFDLRNKYESFGCFMFSLSTWYPEVERPKLPLCIDIIRKFKMENFPQEILKSDGYREFLSACIKQLAARLNYPVFEVTGHGRLEFADLVGHLTVKNGSMYCVVL